MNPLRRIGAAFKALSSMVFGGRSSSGWWSNALGRTNRNYEAAVGDGRGNSIVCAVVEWACRTFPEAPLRVSRMTKNGPEVIPNHPMVALFQRPNPYYSGLLLWQGIIADRMLTGNAYLLKVRSGAGRPVALYWVPSTLIEPKWPDDGSQFISHYEYSPSGQLIRLDPADVVHFRDGFDPNNLRKGRSPLASLFREIFTDDAAANYTSSLLANHAIPGVVITAGKDVALTPADAEGIKADFVQRFGGDNVGQPLVLGAEANVTVMGFSPQQMDLAALRAIPEERITSVYGIPAAVVGLGTGLEQTKVGATMRELRELAYESHIVPTQRLLAADLASQLLPDFGAAGDSLTVDFDLSQVRVLQEDQDALHTRLREDLKAGGITLNMFLTGIGKDALPKEQGDVFYLPISVTPTDPAELLAPPEPQMEVIEQPSNLRALPSGGKAWGLPTMTDYPHVNPSELTGGGVKGAGFSAPSFERLRQRLTTRAERDVARFLGAQASRVAGRLENAPKALKAASPDDLLPTEESALLATALAASYLAALNGVHEWVQDQLGIAFDLDDPTVRDFLRTVGANIPTITATTRDAIREALAVGQEAGEGIPDLAKRLRGLPAFSRERATLVARTEMGYAANGATLNRYEASGVVVGVRVFDGDQDGECAAANGRTLSLADARTFPRLGHPNCVRAFGPVTDAADLPSPETRALERMAGAIVEATHKEAPVPLVTVDNHLPAPRFSRVRKTVERDTQGRITAVVEHHEPVEEVA